MKIKTACLMMTISLASCVSHQVIIITPPLNTQLIAAKLNAVKPCFFTPDEKEKYGSVNALSKVNTINQKAQTAHMDGCAKVEFQLDPDGHPRNLHLVQEVPAGWDFGQTLLDETAAGKFTPKDNNPIIPDKWYALAEGSAYSVTSTASVPPPSDHH